MADEKSLQEQLRSALKNNPDVLDVTVKAGPTEYGIDIVFDYKDRFGETRRVGIQIKDEPTMNAGSCLKAIGQLTVALGHAFVIGSTRTKLDTVYLVNSGKFSATAQEYLADAWEITRTICWVDGSRLLPFIESFKDEINFQDESS